MSKTLSGTARTMGTMPVFMTAISTILGAILFLRFGYSMGHVGLFATLGIILLGHLVTIPTAMAVAEIATNQKVEGGGAYYMISRSFGLNIGGAIGIALFLSQAISVAFYIIAFTVATEDLRVLIAEKQGFMITDQYMNFGMMGLLSLLMLTKGADIGVKALYVVVAILFGALICFFVGGTTENSPTTIDWFAKIPEKVSATNPGWEWVHIERVEFFTVFTIIFPAFTGIAAGLGLSGDLKDPKKSIPRGTLWATVAGILVYIAVAFKLHLSASSENLAVDEMWMEQISIWGPAIALGLACAAVSSALGSIMIAPRTLQALGTDNIFPGGISRFASKGKAKNNEPFNATVITCIIGFLFVSLGSINVVAEVISMFFMLTYGAICMVSFFEHFAADPSYRPTFKSKWYISLFGGLLCFWLMFQMNPAYAAASIILMVLIYIWITTTNKDQSGLANLFKGVIFQINRSLQIFLQRREASTEEDNWRPFVICISKDSFKRSGAFSMVSWISHKYGFGTYMHYIEGFLTKATKDEAMMVKERLIKQAHGLKSRVYLDTIISPSYTSAIAQSIQLPGISGKGNNMILFEYSTSDTANLEHYVTNAPILTATDFDVCILRSSYKGFGFQKEIHIWITATDYLNSNLMILLGYIILGHPDWRNAEIKIFSIYDQGDLEEQKEDFLQLIKSGRLPISAKNIELIQQGAGEDYRKIINAQSTDADLTIIGFDEPDLEKEGLAVFEGFDDIGNILFVNANNEKGLE
jgi:amino acid transporter